MVMNAIQAKERGRNRAAKRGNGDPETTAKVIRKIKSLGETLIDEVLGVEPDEKNEKGECCDGTESSECCPEDVREDGDGVRTDR